MNFTTVFVSALALASVTILTPAAVADQPQLAYETTQTSVTSIDDPCPPGSRWEAAGYQRGKWRSAHCTPLVSDR